MFKKLEVAVPEVRFQFYSFQPVAQFEEQFLPESWVDQTQVWFYSSIASNQLPSLKNSAYLSPGLIRLR